MMRATRWSWVCALAVLGAGCGDDDGGGAPDAGMRGDASTDASPQDATTGDAGTCVPLRVTSWELEGIDDVSIGYITRMVPQVGGQTYDLTLRFLRYGDQEYVGTFDLGSGVDDNHSTCARCVAAYTGTTSARGFFVEAGTLELTADPFEMQLTGALRGLRLIEVTIEGETLMSVPVPNGRCMVVEDSTFDRRYPAPGWTCADEAYGDGETCDCGCGPIDPDCWDGERPVAGCAAGEACVAVPNDEIFRLDGVCIERCSRSAGDACSEGVCAFGPTGFDVCYPEAQADRDAALGATCAEGGFLCAIDEGGFARGVCDVNDRADGQCRPTCAGDGDCDASAFERCYTITGADVPEGFCSPRYPADWTCSGDRYEDGTYCDCECGAVDPDCWDTTRDERGCEAGESCLYDGSCAPIPPNDTCASATPLTTGVTITGTTRGARPDYTAGVEKGSCVDSQQQGPDVVYSITLAAGQRLDVTATPASHNLALALLGPGAPSICDATASACVAGVDEGRRGEAETLSFTATTAGTYYLVVDSFWNEELGDFALQATLTP